MALTELTDAGLLSTDQLRDQLFGDDTHARRPWRLAVTQALNLPAPVEWIGRWHHPKAPQVLEPGSACDRHTYAVELDLPRWTTERDVDLRNWLCGFGDGVRTESPEALKMENRDKAAEVVALYP